MKIIQKRNTLPRMQICTLILTSVVFSLFAAYIYFLSASVMHVVVRTDISNEISELNSEIGQLEAEYIARQYDISDEIVAQSGFVAVEDKIFLDQTSANVVVSAE